MSFLDKPWSENQAEITEQITKFLSQAIVSKAITMEEAAGVVLTLSCSVGVSIIGADRMAVELAAGSKYCLEKALENAVRH